MTTAIVFDEETKEAIEDAHDDYALEQKYSFSVECRSGKQVVETIWTGLHGQGSHVQCCYEVVNSCDVVSVGVSKDGKISCNELLEGLSELFEVKLSVDYGESVRRIYNRRNEALLVEIGFFGCYDEHKRCCVKVGLQLPKKTQQRRRKCVLRAKCVEFVGKGMVRDKRDNVQRVVTCLGKRGFEASSFSTVVDHDEEAVENNQGGAMRQKYSRRKVDVNEQVKGKGKSAFIGAIPNKRNTRTVDTAIPIWDDVNGYVKPDVNVFPPIITDSRLYSSIVGFAEEVADKKLREELCGVCGGRRNVDSLTKYHWGSRQNVQHKVKVESVLRSVPVEKQCSQWGNDPTYVRLGYLLEVDGVVFDGDGEVSVINICKECDRMLERNQMPQCAYMNGTWVGGDYDGFFQNVSMIEEHLIAKNMTHGWIATLKSQVSGPGQQQRCLRGNVITYPVNFGETHVALAEVKTLPKGLEKVMELIAVEFYGNFSKKTLASVESVNRLLQVRRGVVERALEILTEINPNYADTQMNEEVLEGLSESGVPPTVWDHIFRQHRAEEGGAVAAETTGYCGRETWGEDEKGEEIVEGKGDVTCGVWL